MVSPEVIWTLMSIAGGTFAAGKFIVPSCVRGVQRVRSIFEKVDQMHQEIGDNGGKSLKDFVRKSYGLAQVSDARLDLVLDLVDVPVFECEPSGQNVRINDAFTRRFGWAPAEMLGHQWIRILHEDDRDEYVRDWLLAVRDKRAFSCHARYCTRFGVVIEVHVLAQPNFDKTDGHIVRWLGRVDTVAASAPEKKAS